MVTTVMNSLTTQSLVWCDGSPVKAREWEKTLKVKCRLCGGARCKRCSESAALAKQDSPVKGLHADWVADCALAMMRPSSRLMNEYKIAEQFHKLNITAVFNLTLPGEHPYCGDGLGIIRFYNFGWEDMTTPTLSFMMDIVKVIASVLLTGHHRVAVHCHAGYGRTGIAIACAIIFLHNIPPELAIRLVRRDRPGSVQTAGQVQFVHDFHAYLNAARVVFALPKIHDRFTLAETVEHQNRRLHGEGASTASSRLPLRRGGRCYNRIFRRRDGCFGFRQSSVRTPARSLARTIECTKEFYRPTPSDSAELLGGHRQFIGGAVNESLRDCDSISFDSIEPPEPATREQLFPIKVGFNVGEWNWEEASALCPNASTHAVLLLDWLEHLLPRTPPTPSICHAISGSDMSCLRVLEAKLEQFATGDVLFNAVCVRTAMALFHLSTTSCSTSSLRRHGDCVALLIDKWHAPKRLELNLESLQKLSVHRPSTCPRPSISCAAIATSSPRPSPRSSSPMKIDPLPTSIRREEDGKPPGLTLPLTPKKMDLSPLAPQPLPEKEFELNDDSFAVTLSAEFTSMDPPALPSVRDGGRYSRRAGNTVK
ncbi:Protein-tyrosine phosphatase-like [Phytophthora cactorum]|nr:Protein-tyrosine phosphatase-like [Phytophthora cactorum]